MSDGIVVKMPVKIGDAISVGIQLGNGDSTSEGIKDGIKVGIFGFTTKPPVDNAQSATL
jgi:hypothetical protein